MPEVPILLGSVNYNNVYRHRNNLAKNLLVSPDSG